MQTAENAPGNVLGKNGAVSCLCGTMSLKTTPDGEICCRQCGVSFGYGTANQSESPSKLSLILRNSVGGGKSKFKPENTKRLHIHNSDMPIVSDTCSKLELPRATEEDVWLAYNELRARGMSKPNSAAFALYRVIRLNDLPILDMEVVSRIQMTFHVQRVPTYLAVMSEVNKLSISFSRSYLITDPRRVQSSRYYLKIHVKKTCMRHRSIPFDFLLQRAERIFNSSRIPNLDTRAKRAVEQVLAKLGMV